jgi:hypothetical protein
VRVKLGRTATGVKTAFGLLLTAFGWTGLPVLECRCRIDGCALSLIS